MFGVRGFLFRLCKKYWGFLGLSAPVPRGRKGKKVKAQSSQPMLQDADWLTTCNPDVLFQEDSYRKHLKHHCNK